MEQEQNGWMGYRPIFGELKMQVGLSFRAIKFAIKTFFFIKKGNITLLK